MKKLFVMGMLLAGVFAFADPSVQTGLGITPFEGAWEEESSGDELVFIGNLALFSDDGDNWDIAVFSHDSARLYLLEDGMEESAYVYSISGNTLRLTDDVNEELVFTRAAGQTGTKTELEGTWNVEVEGESFTMLFRKNFVILMELEEAVMFSLKNGRIAILGEEIFYTLSGDTLVISDENERIELQRIGP
ncbi:MAG: hypothetical protein LBK77_07980 [Spirochaetaceae bacterium]|nr:hypothetical protein [Spirochaetaceae bacterium]